MTDLQRRVLAAGFSATAMAKSKQKRSLLKPWVVFLLGLLVGSALYAVFDVC